MSDDPVAMITISSSDNEDVQVVQTASRSMETNSHSSTSAVKRIPLQRIPSAKDIFSEFVEKYKSTTKDKLEEIETISKKLWKRFDEATPDYTKSKSFKEFMIKATESYNNEFAHRQILAVCDELRNHKKTQVKPISKNCSPSSSTAPPAESSEQELDPKSLLHLKKLEKLKMKLHYRIQKLENSEVDLNSSDEENSAYLQVDKYKTRFCQVFKKICEIKKKDPHAERAFKKHIKFSGVSIPEVNKAIEKFYNAHREFPDYRDILTVVKKANEVKKLDLSTAEINGIALKAFQELGKTLKKYRQWDDVEIFRSYFNDDEDPASKDEELKNTLEENRKKFGNRIDEVIDKYAVMQEDERLEGTEFDSNAEEEQDDDEEAPETDNESPSSMLESKSESEESSDGAEDEDHPKCKVVLTDHPKCKVVLTDVKFSPAWEQYVVRKQQPKSIDLESDSNGDSSVVIETSSPSRCSRKRSLESESEDNDSRKGVLCSEEPIPSTSKQSVPITLSNYRHIKRSKKEKPENLAQDDDDDTSPKSANDSKVDSASAKVFNNDINMKNSSSISPNSSIINNSKKESPEKPTDSIPPTVDIIEIDNEDLPKKPPEDVKAKTSNSKEKEHHIADVQNHFLCNGDPLPLEVVLDVDAPNTSKSEPKKSESEATTDDYNDEIVFVDEIIKTKNPTKANNDIIDIVEISDSPEKSKQLLPKSLSQPVNLTQFIRSMKFGGASASNSGIMASSSKQVTTTRNNFSQVNRGSKGRNPFQNCRQTAPNSVSTVSRTLNNFSSMAQSVNPFVNQRQQSSNNRQFASSTHSRNMQNMQNFRFLENNVNSTMKSGQAAVQRKQISERTVQMFDAKTNRMVTRKETTTIVQQSVTQYVSQNQRVLNHRQVQPVRRPRVAINRSINSEDVITLE